MTIECEKVGLDYLETAPIRHTASERIRATPEDVFAAFLDADAWVRFAWPIEEVIWTSGLPLEVGSTRDVRMKGDLVGHEEFIAYEHGRRMAFRFNQVSKGGVTAFAEDYQVTDLGDGSCRVDWTMAMGSPGDPPPSGMATLRRPLMGWFVRHTLRRFRSLVEAEYVAQGVR